MSNWDEIAKALQYVDSHDRDIWFEMGAALKDELGEAGFDLWDAWSQSADSYNSRDAKAVWKSIRPGHIHIGTLFHHARANGFRPAEAYVPPTPEELAQRTAESQARREAEAQELLARQVKARSTAQGIWNRSEPMQTPHPYLVAKGIEQAGVVAGLRTNAYQGQVNLLVPVYADGQLVNLQSIGPDGSKRFLTGGQVKGGYMVVGDMQALGGGVVIAEGFATAASIHQATGQPVVVAFNAGNMVEVSRQLAQTLPSDVAVTLAVDNDASKTGMTKAQEAARFFEGRAQAIQPEFTMAQIERYQRERGAGADGRPRLPSDFNDLHHLAGIEAVRHTLGKGLSMQASEKATVSAQPVIPAVDESNEILPVRATGEQPAPAVEPAAPPPTVEVPAEQSHKPVPGERTPSRPMMDTDPAVTQFLLEHFDQRGKNFYAKGTEHKVFTDRGGRITSALEDRNTIAGMLACAQAKGWQTLEVKGTEAFRRQAWYAAKQRGLEVQGYEPTPQEAALFPSKSPAQPGPAKAELNVLAPVTRAASGGGTVKPLSPDEEKVGLVGPARIEASLDEAHRHIAQALGDKAKVFRAETRSGNYRGEIIAETQMHVVQRISPRMAVIHSKVDVAGGIIGQRGVYAYKGGRAQFSANREQQLAKAGLER